MSNTKRETWVDDRTSATSGTATVATKSAIDNRDVEQFDELLIYLNVTTPLVGTSPTMNIYLQRAIVPNPDAANDAHWVDIAAFDQVLTSTIERIHTLPWLPTQADREITLADHARNESALTARSARVGHWGNLIRIREKMGGTITQAAVYSIHVTGIAR